VKAERGEAVFLVRMWRQEGETSAGGEWRGSVLEIDSGVRFYVSGAHDIADFVAARLAEKDA
jgi:hypothetical protein